jgi:ABC-type phosphate transport system, periplasmic component
MMPETDADLTRRTFLAGAATTGAVAAAGCTSNNTGTEDSGSLSGDIGIAGSSTVFPLSVAMRKRFVEEHENVDISVQSTGSGGGFANYFCPW